MAGNNADPTWTLLLVLGVFGLLCWGVWYAFHVEMMEAIRYIRIVEIAPLSLFDEQAKACMQWLRVAEVGDGMPTKEAFGASIACFGKENLASLNAQNKILFYNITPDSLGYVSRFIGSYLRWILVVVAAYVIYYALYVTERNKYRTTFNLESFIAIQAKVWPVIAPIVKFNPAKSSSRIVGDSVPSKLPLFAEALAPEEWIAYHKIPMVEGVPQRQAAYNAFALQLGPRSTSFAKMPTYIQALLAAFALKGVQKREESDEFLGRLSLCWSEKTGFKLTPELAREIKRILKDPKIGGEAVKIAQNHAYRTPAILGVLKWARFMGGVLASAQFLWLRGVDRHLWYALNNLGRRSFHTEGAGAMAHFMAEEIAKKPLIVPRLETAILTINKYVSEKDVQIPSRAEGTTLTYSS